MWAADLTYTVYGVDDEGTTAFTRFGIENLEELIANPDIIESYRKLF